MNFPDGLANSTLRLCSSHSCLCLNCYCYGGDKLKPTTPFGPKKSSLPLRLLGLNYSCSANNNNILQPQERVVRVSLVPILSRTLKVSQRFGLLINQYRNDHLHHTSLHFQTTLLCSAPIMPQEDRHLCSANRLRYRIDLHQSCSLN